MFPCRLSHQSTCFINVIVKMLENKVYNLVPLRGMHALFTVLCHIVLRLKLSIDGYPGIVGSIELSCYLFEERYRYREAGKMQPSQTLVWTSNFSETY